MKGKRIAHLVAAPVENDEVDCRVDWDRRFDHMQQHSGQHLLSAVFVEHFGIATVSFHLGQESSTIDLDTAALEPARMLEAERRANQVVFENRSLAVSFEDAAQHAICASLPSAKARYALSASKGWTAALAAARM